MDEAGFHYELYGEYTGKGDLNYEIEYQDICAWNYGIDYAIPIGAILANFITGAAAPLGKIAALSATLCGLTSGTICFGAPSGIPIRLYVLKTDFKYEYKGEEHEIAIMGLMFYRPGSS